jgi:hypothetical protein
MSTAGCWNGCIRTTLVHAVPTKPTTIILLLEGVVLVDEAGDPTGDSPKKLDSLSKVSIDKDSSILLLPQLLLLKSNSFRDSTIFL